MFEAGDERLLLVINEMPLPMAERHCDGRPHRTGPVVAAAAQFAGTDEGRGFAGFRQGHHNPVWDAVSRDLWYRSRRLREAHAPKAVVLPAWLVNKVHPMVAERVPVHLLRIGRFYLIGISGEVTIVAGLRLRRAVGRVRYAGTARDRAGRRSDFIGTTREFAID